MNYLCSYSFNLGKSTYEHTMINAGTCVAVGRRAILAKLFQSKFLKISSEFGHKFRFTENGRKIDRNHHSWTHPHDRFNSRRKK